jgi:hypothetical protein
MLWLMERKKFNYEKIKPRLIAVSMKYAKQESAEKLTGRLRLVKRDGLPFFKSNVLHVAQQDLISINSEIVSYF